MREASASAWAVEEFRGARFKDPRWRSRLVSVGAQAARRPAGRVTETFVSSADRQGAYGLLESDAVGSEEIGRAIFEACARRCAGEPYVLCPIDGTSLTLTDDDKSKGFGPIGSRAEGGRGLKVMNAMVLSADGVAIGISSLRYTSEAKSRSASP